MSFLRTVFFRVGPRLLMCLAGVLVSGALAQGVSALAPFELGGYVWLDVNRQPLPFQDHTTIRDMMGSARVVSRKLIGRGISGTEKLTLEYDNTRFHAAFRTIDLTVRPSLSGRVERSTMKYRDAAIFESAAYELSELLGIGRVPPVVERHIDTTSGTVQIWMEETRPEVELLKRKELHPPDVARWLQQKQIMYLFDSLIANRDRNQGNILIDHSWTLWFIDHTRAFMRFSELLYRDKLTACERGLWSSLREIDDGTLRQRLEPYLERQEIAKLLTRRRKLVRHIQSLIDKNGEDAVLFDLRPPGTEKADWSD